MNLTVDLAIKIYECGVSYGLLQAENERTSEEWADAFNCYFVDKKWSMPSYPRERLHARSKEWKKEQLKKTEDFFLPFLVVKIAEKKLKEQG